MATSTARKNERIPTVYSTLQHHSRIPIAADGVGATSSDSLFFYPKTHPGPLEEYYRDSAAQPPVHVLRVVFFYFAMVGKGVYHQVQSSL